MKQIICFLLFATFHLAGFAQGDNTHVTLHAGDVPIEAQLSDEQKQAVTHLTITGKLLDEDYAYMRSTLLDKLEELNLRKADIDTIPAKALEYSGGDYDKEGGYFEKIDGKWQHISYSSRLFKIILPEKLRHLSTRCFWMSNLKIQFVITGWFPTLEENVFYTEQWNAWLGTIIGNEENHQICISSDDNPHCVNINDSGVYSVELDTLYFGFAGCREESILQGTKVIANRAFESNFSNVSSINIPSSVEHIGDYAFFHFAYPMPVCNGANFCFYNYSHTPQRISAHTFEPLVPFEILVFCEDLNIYKNTDIWKDMPIYPMNWSDVDSQIERNEVVISETNGGWQINSGKMIKHIMVTDLSGLVEVNNIVYSTKVTIPLTGKRNSIHLLTLTFDDGTTETHKIKL